MKTTIFAVAGDPGGAAALAPVLLNLAPSGAVTLFARAYREARNVWTAAGIPFESLDESLTTLECEDLLRQSNARALLCGTSVNGVDLEKRFVAAARRLGVPSLAVLDFWSNLRPRFSDEFGNLAFVPDRVAVMDEVAREELLAEGIPADRIFVTGQPAFDDLAEWAQRDGATQSHRLRTALGVPESAVLVLFASQPIAEMQEAHAGIAHPGYTQHSVLTTLLPVLEEIRTASGRDVRIWIRPHPRELKDAYTGYASDNPSWVVVSSIGKPREAACAADLVTGMSSVLLFEAAVMGRAVLSLQPGLRIPDPLPLARLGMGETVYTDASVAPAIRTALSSPASRIRSKLPAFLQINAVARIKTLLDAMVPTSLMDPMPPGAAQLRQPSRQ